MSADLARAMLDAAVRDEQCARRVADDAEADSLRVDLRAVARERGIRIRTARLDDAVVVVLADAAVWHEDAATMRRTLSPAD